MIDPNGDSTVHPQEQAAHKVVCPSCNRSHYHTIPGVFDPNAIISPDMVQMMEPWAGWRWTGFSHNRESGYGQMECLECGSALAPNGKLKLGDRIILSNPEVDKDQPPQPEKPQPEFSCEVCGKTYKMPGAFYNHIKTCRSAEKDAAE